MPIQQYICVHCGKVFSANLRPSRPPRQFCSRKCQYEHYSATHRASLTCNTCGRTFEVTKRRASQNPQYCSSECFGKSLEQKVMLHCIMCGKPFSVTPGQARKRLYCSQACLCEKKKMNRVKRECAFCGQTFEVPPNQARKAGRYCSTYCVSQARKLIRGENHPSWKGGADYNYHPYWEEIANSIRSRDGYCCTRCGMTNYEHQDRFGASLHVHHIIPFRWSHDNSPDNLRTLCLNCHKFVESQFIWLL